MKPNKFLTNPFAKKYRAQNTEQEDIDISEIQNSMNRSKRMNGDQKQDMFCGVMACVSAVVIGYIIISKLVELL